MPASPTPTSQPPLHRHSSPSRKAVHFASTPEATKHRPSPTGKGSSAPAAVAAPADASHSPECPASGSVRASFNQLFSPRPGQDDDDWTIEAQRSDRMGCAEAPGTALSGAGASARPGPASTALSKGSPLSLLSDGPAESYTPASAGFLESARKVDDLRGRLESLEASLKEMESKAVAQLDKSLQEKVLATAAKIVQKRFMADKELDKKLQQQILQTAVKVVRRQSAAATAAAAVAGDQRGAATVAHQAAQPQQEQEADPTRRLEFEQGEPAGSAAAAVSEQVQAYVAHIEQGFGEVLRRLEKKVDAVASLLDQNALELLEARMAGGLVKLESRLAAVEEATAALVQHQQRQSMTQQPTAEDASTRLLERVAAVEAAMTEQSRAVADLLKVLGTPGMAAAQQAVAAVAGVQLAAEAAAAGDKQPPAAAAGASSKPAPELSAAKAERSAPAPAPEAQKREQEPQQPAAQLVHRRAAAARRSMLSDPGRSAAAGLSGSAQPLIGTAAAASPRARPDLPRLTATHAAGTAQQIAMATAREQLARQAARAREEAEAEAPVWATMFYVFGWGILIMLGLAAVLIGMVAALMKSGRLTEDDLAFLWEVPQARR